MEHIEKTIQEDIVKMKISEQIWIVVRATTWGTVRVGENITLNTMTTIGKIVGNRVMEMLKNPSVSIKTARGQVQTMKNV